MKERIRRQRRLFSGLIIVLTAFLSLRYLVLPRMDAPRTVALLCDQSPEGYAQLITARRDDLDLEWHDNKYLLDLLDGDTAYVQTEDARVAARLRAGMPGTFTPHFLSTIVFVLPASAADEAPESFAALARSEFRLYLPDVHKVRVLPAMALALGNGENLDAAMGLLAGLKLEGRLIIGKTSAGYADVLDDRTIAVMPDDEAAKLILSGWPVEMQIPSDGTLSFVVGLYSPSGSVPEIALSEAELTGVGLRTLDGQSLTGLYPEPTSYANARAALEEASYMQLAADVTARFRRELLGTHLYSTATGRERVLLGILMTIALAFWGITLFWRIVRPRLRRLVQVETGLLILWVLLQLLRMSADTYLTRYLWYLYYLPLIGSVIAFSLATLEISEIEETRRRKLTSRWVISGLMLLALVMTNDLHQIVFRFPDGASRFGTYRHNIGFFLLTGWVLLLAVDSLQRLVRYAGRRRDHKYLGLLALLFAALLAYNVFYVLGLPAVRNTQMATVFIVSILLFWELTMRSGLIPYNRNYRYLFQHSRIPLYLLDGNGKLIRRSAQAQPLPAEITYQTAAGQRLFFAADDTPGELGPDYEAAPIAGGYVVWKNNLQGIRRLTEDLHGMRVGLLSEMTSLQAQVDQERLLQGVAVRSSLYQSLGKLIRPRLTRVSQLAGDLSVALPMGRLRSDLREVGTHLGFCKRAGLMHLNALLEGRVQTNLLAMLLGEVFAELEDEDFVAGLFSEPSGAVTLPVAMACLSFIDQCFSALRERIGSGSLLGNLSTADNRVIISMLVDLPEPDLKAIAARAEAERAQLVACGINLTIRDEAPSLRLVLAHRMTLNG